MEQSIPSVALTNCVAIVQLCHSDFACYESTLAVHSENPFMVSNLTTGNSGQLKMSAKFRSSQKRRFWIWSYKRNVLYFISKHIRAIVRMIKKDFVYYEFSAGHSFNSDCFII